MAVAGVKGWKTPTTSGDEYATLKVGMAFGSRPFPSSCNQFLDRTWTDVSTSVRYCHITRGRTHDLDVFGPDTCEMVLDNRRRLYDPTCTTSVQAGNVIPGVPVRVDVAIPNGSTNTIYTGYVEGWGLEYPGMLDATVTARCANGLKFLALSNINNTTANPIEGARIDVMADAVLDAAGWPSGSGWRNLGTAYTSGTDYVANEAPALEMLRTLADMENGAFFVDISGKARFVNRNFWADDMKTNRATFDDAGKHVPYTDIRISRDDGQLYNRVVVSSVSTHNPSTQSHAGSIASYGERTLTRLGLYMKTTGDADALGSWLVTRYARPGTRVSRIECKPRTSTKAWDLYDNTSGIGIGAKVTVNRRPPGGGLIRPVCHVEGIETTIDVGNNDWTLAFDMSPAELQPTP